MALITCTECNKEISNKAAACIHCGNPISEGSQNNSEKQGLIINGRKIKRDEIVHIINTKEKITAIKEINKITELGLKQAKEFVDNYPESLDDFETIDMKKEKNSVKCPNCGSTEFEMVARKWSFATGLFTNKVDRVCINCKKRF